jgi:hypothetical protein
LPDVGNVARYSVCCHDIYGETDTRYFLTLTNIENGRNVV